MKNPEQKEIDTQQVIRFLTHSFASITQGMGKAIRSVDNKKVTTTPLYEFQVEFCHMIHDIGYGPKYLIPKVIADCNEFIRKINENRQQEKS